MIRPKQTEISVTTVFSGKQEGRQAFIDLIIRKIRADEQKNLDSALERKYNCHKVFSDVRVN
jgi:hypothetical protein